MTSLLEQFTAFGTDAVGLERLLRLFQSIGLVLASYPALLNLIVPESADKAHVSNIAMVIQLTSRLNIIRRTMRLFRFLDGFQSSWAVYGAREKTLEIWCDVLSSSFWGMFGLVESITLPDLLDVQGLEIFGPQLTQDMNLQAQIIWFAALYASALGSGIRIIRTLAYQPVPQTGDAVQASYSEKSASNNSANSSMGESTKEEEMRKEREHLKGLVKQQKEEKKASGQDVGQQVLGMSLSLLADILDMVIPASTLGWVDVDAGSIGVVMVITTILTSMGPWERCGRTAQA